jgi:DNA-binding transcriptional MerR regulator
MVDGSATQIRLEPSDAAPATATDCVPWPANGADAVVASYAPTGAAARPCADASADTDSDTDRDGGPGLSIAQAAKATGVSADTLRYYERAGLMRYRVARRSSHRRYSAADLRWIGTLTALRRTGMPIRQIAEYAALVRAGDGNEAQRFELLAGHRRRVAERLAEVSRHLDAIDAKIAKYASRSEPNSESRLI